MATARPSVLRQVENEIHKKDAETTGLIKDLQKVRTGCAWQELTQVQQHRLR